MLKLKRERSQLKASLVRANIQSGDLKIELKMAHADLEKEKIKEDACLVAAELNRSHQRHIRVLASTNLTAALKRKPDRLNDTIAHDKIELAQIRQANRLMEGRIEKLEKEESLIRTGIIIMAKMQVKSTQREEIVRARDNELTTISARLQQNKSK